MIICGLLSCRHSLGVFNDISYSSLRPFSIATRAKHPVQAEACRVELGHFKRRPITLLCLERVVPLAVPGALLSPAQTCHTGTRNRRQPWSIWLANGGKVSGLDQLHRQPRFLAGGGKALVHGGE